MSTLLTMSLICTQGNSQMNMKEESNTLIFNLLPWLVLVK